MYRFILCATIGSLMLLSADGVHAQARPFIIGLGGGPSFPVGSEFSDEAGTGYHVVGSVGFAPAVLPVGVRADLTWQELPDEIGGDFREIGGLVNAMVGVPSVGFRPYLMGGVGAINHNPPEHDDGHGHDHDHGHEHGHEEGTRFAWNLGGGVQFGLAGLAAVVEARYLAGGEGHKAVPITFGIRF